MMTAMTRNPVVASNAAAAVVADHVRQMILSGELRRGQKLPTEREMTQGLGLSRTSVRAGLQLLASKGILVIRHGKGTFVADGPLILDSEQFHFLSALHGYSRTDMFEARRSLESTVAGLAAQRATGDDLAAISDAVTGMFVSLSDPLEFLRYDAAFHRAVAAASRNPIMASLVEMVSGMFFEARKGTAHRGRALQPVAEKHRLIYTAIRDRDGAAASQHMVEHLVGAERLQREELSGESPGSESAEPDAVSRAAS
jgi:GntR family transcriptional repressor for pyruvate dehydrogenase complex